MVGWVVGWKGGIGELSPSGLDVLNCGRGRGTPLLNICILGSFDPPLERETKGCTVYKSL